MSPNIFGMPILYCIYWISLIRLNPEVCRFAYSGMRWEDCECTLCSSLLGESSIAASRLTPVGVFSPLWWLTWWFFPPWRVTYLVKSPSLLKGLGVSDLASVPWYVSGSSVVPLGADYGEGPAIGSWWSVSRGSSCKASLGGFMIKDELICHSFVRVNFYWVESSDCSSTRSSNLMVPRHYSCAKQWRNCHQITNDR